MKNACDQFRQSLSRMAFQWSKKGRIKTMDFPVKAMAVKLGYWVRVRDRR